MIVIDVVGTWAAVDNKGAQTMMPTQIANATRDVKRVFDLRNVVLMSVTFPLNKLDHPSLMDRGYLPCNQQRRRYRPLCRYY